MNIAKALIFVGMIIVLIGCFIFILSKMGVPLFKLPGDIKIGGGKYSVSIPIVTCILISIFLTVIINVILWLVRR